MRKNRVFLIKSSFNVVVVFMLKVALIGWVSSSASAQTILLQSKSDLTRSAAYVGDGWLMLRQYLNSYGDAFVMEAGLNGHLKSFLVDTGANSTVISSEIAKEMRLPCLSQVEVSGVSSASLYCKSKLDFINVSGIVIKDIEVFYPKDPSIPAHYILGLDVLDKLEVKYRDGQMFVRPLNNTFSHYSTWLVNCLNRDVSICDGDVIKQILP